MVNTLILGGTRFVGRALLEAALTNGHTVTLFNRGRTNAELRPEVERIIGDRGGDLTALSERPWDVVFDVAAYDPEFVERSTSALVAKTDMYVFVSSLSVYSNQAHPHGEDSPTLQLSGSTPEDQMYGARKARSETIVRSRFGENHFIVRAGMIVGPHDPTDRLTYWPRRIAQGGRVLCPGSRADPLQFIDVRDLAEWMVGFVEERRCGTYNATGAIVSFGDFIDTCCTVTGVCPETVWVSTDRLLAAGVDPWMGVPLWIGAEGWEAANRMDISRAVQAGLTFRPLVDIVRDAWEYDRHRRASGDGPMMLSGKQEAQLLQACAPSA
ncbi:MAG TPA: NAD-dependent epimerase/dehydratase family protein [Chloroflexota bacterium]|nr:NAD-dependent epimerase/dehydratase family protein [Chloroflexota bacterium]